MSTGGAARLRRALPPATLYDPAQRGLHQVVAAGEETDGGQCRGRRDSQRHMTLRELCVLSVSAVNAK